jgi:CDP-diacylglycerol---serine O-phosphatidyltransferase
MRKRRFRRFRRNRFKQDPIKLRFRLHKALFVLPNLFTLSSVFCGLYAISLATSGTLRLYQAGLAVFFGIFFDMADGRVARLTRTQSDFGVQLDSLADMIAFGVAPGVIVHAWAFEKLGMSGLFLAFIYVACGALRLARFNVLAARSSGPTNYFIGLPIPLAAGVLVSLIMFHQRTYGGPVRSTTQAVIVVLILAYLMISNVRYRNFKNVDFSQKTLLAVAGVMATFAAVSYFSHATFALLLFSGVYILVGLVEEIVFYKTRSRPEKSQFPPANSQSEAALGDKDRN